MSDQQSTYTIPARFRRMENMHIVFWLFKDISWCMLWKVLGIAMIFPTLIVAIIIAYRTRQRKSELAHNLAIAFWITANSYWMISEFFGFDSVKIFGDYEGKHFALIPFAAGVIVLAYYYFFQRKRELGEDHAVTM
jgi:hypothetical protein